jgi:hypothetical protein
MLHIKIISKNASTVHRFIFENAKEFYLIYNTNFLHFLKKTPTVINP